ncbi:MAG: hypothetical protein ABL984_14655 [Pyrinomonadaceae bacterium]
MNAIRYFFAGLVTTLIAASFAFAQADRLQGTLVVAVPVDVGLVVCADKRLNNSAAGSFSDENVKVRRAGPDAVFAATHTVGFYDRKSEKMAFDAFKTTQDYVDITPFSNTKPFWDGLKVALLQGMFTYLSGKPYAAWPETDAANRGLLFNLIFYSISNGRPYSQTVKVMYEKKSTPVVTVMPPFAELVTAPKLSGKGRDVMRYLDRSPSVAKDPAILKFDERTFTVATTHTSDAIDFSRKLFALTSTAVPEAHVSPTFDCALLDRNTGYRALP